MLAAPVGDDEENTPMLVRDSESNTPMLVRDSESTTASGTNQTAQPPRRKIGRCLVRYAAVLPVLFIYMWALLGEEEVTIGGTLENTSPTTSSPTTSPTLTVIIPAPSSAIKPFESAEATAGILLSSVKFVPSTNALYANVSASPFVVSKGDKDKEFSFLPLEELGGDQCSKISSLAVFADARIGGIFDNYWHTVVTFGMAMYWHLPLRFRTSSDIALVIKHPTLQPWHTEEEKEHLVSADWLTDHGVGVNVIKLLFPGGIYVVDINNRDYGTFCADQAYVQTVAWHGDRDKEGGEHNIEDVWDFRTRIMTAISLPNERTAVKGGKIVWVSRAKALYRKHILNEEDLISQLRNDYPSATVDVVDMESMTLKEQATVFADASLVVMVRGAASVNTMYLSREATVFWINFGDGFEPFPHFYDSWFSVAGYVPSTLDRTGQGPNFNNMQLLPNEFWQHFIPVLELAGFSKG